MSGGDASRRGCEQRTPGRAASLRHPRQTDDQQSRRASSSEHDACQPAGGLVMATTLQRERQQRPHGWRPSTAEPQAQPGGAQVTHLRTPTTSQNETETSAPPVLTRKTMPSNEGKTRVGLPTRRAKHTDSELPKRGVRDVLHATGVEKGTEKRCHSDGDRHRATPQMRLRRGARNDLPPPARPPGFGNPLRGINFFFVFGETIHPDTKYHIF